MKTSFGTIGIVALTVLAISPAWADGGFPATNWTTSTLRQPGGVTLTSHF